MKHGITLTFTTVRIRGGTLSEKSATANAVKREKRAKGKVLAGALL